MFSRLKHRTLQSPVYQRLKRKAQNTYLRDKNTSWYLIYQIFVRKFRRNEILARADGVAFNFTLSVFPFIIFLFTLIPYIPAKDLDRQIMSFLGEVLPAGIFADAAPTINDIVSRPRGQLLSLGAILALYAGTAGMMALMSAFNKMYRTTENRGFLRTRLIATGLVLMLVIVMLIGIASIVVGRFVLEWIFGTARIDDYWLYWWINLLRYAVVFIVFFVGISTIYYVAPAITKRWRFFSYGSAAASVLAILSTQLFSYYFSNFASYNRLYGSIGTFIAMMVWFLLISIILLLGFEINASVDEARTESRMQQFKANRQYHQIRPGDQEAKKRD
jgi:membrane protein